MDDSFNFISDIVTLNSILWVVQKKQTLICSRQFLGPWGDDFLLGTRRDRCYVKWQELLNDVPSVSARHV